MPETPKNIGKIALYGLPDALAAAISAHIGTVPAESADVIVCLPGESRVPPATALVTLTPGRPEPFGQFLRRLARAAAEPALHIGDFAVGAYLFSPQDKSLTRQDAVTAAAPIALTDRESDMLIYIARQRGRAVGRDELLKNVWRYQDGVDTHTLETHIYRLRQKLGDGPALLVTEDDGYALAPVVSAATPLVSAATPVVDVTPPA